MKRSDLIYDDEIVQKSKKDLTKQVQVGTYLFKMIIIIKYFIYYIANYVLFYLKKLEGFVNKLTLIILSRLLRDNKVTI